MAVFPIYNMLIVPDANIFFKTDYYQSLTGKPPVLNEKVVLIVAREDLTREEFTNDSFYPIGLIGVITEIMIKPTSTAMVMIITGSSIATI